ncbi:MAG: GGDEF domain-containing protein [Methyloligella sp. ZOD6]
MFDKYTTGLIVEAACVLGCLIILSYWIKDRKSSAYLWWIGGFVLSGLGVLLSAQRAYLPLVLNHSLPGLIALLGAVSLWVGLRAFDRRPMPRLAILPPAIWMLGLPLFHADFTMRQVLYNIAIGTTTLLISLDLWRHSPKDINPRTCIAAICLLETAISYSQAVALFIMRDSIGDGPLSGWLTFAPFQTAIAMIAIVLFGIQMISERSHQRLRRLALRDDLSGALNRRGFFEFGEAALLRQAGHNRETSIVVFDIDRFKSINDTYGHAAGDKSIAAFAERVGKVLRPDDLFGRIGGEEFALLLPNTPLDQAIRIAERIRETVAAMPIDCGVHEIAVTTSAGVTSAPNGKVNLDRLIATADAALYDAKASGRNQTKILESIPAELRHLDPIVRMGRSA